MTNFDYYPHKFTKYTVQPKDNLVKITKKFDVPLRKIMFANPYINPYLLFVGQTLNIPVEYKRKSLENNYSDENVKENKLYFIKQGDTLDSIAKQFKTSKEEILNLNRNKKLNKVSVGQKLKIPFMSDRFSEVIGKICSPLIESPPMECRRLLKSQVIAIETGNEEVVYMNSINDNAKKILDSIGINNNDLVRVTYSNDIMEHFKTDPVYTLLDIYCVKKHTHEYV